MPKHESGHEPRPPQPPRLHSPPPSPKPSKVIATAGATTDSVQVSHNDFPELRADGDSLEDAAANLVQGLTREINEVEDESRRDSLRRAIAEVQDFIERPAAG